MDFLLLVPGPTGAVDVSKMAAPISCPCLSFALSKTDEPVELLN